MKNTFGNALSITLFGESHGEAIGAVVDGIAPGIKIDEKFIEKQMNKRKAYGKISTSRNEEDKVEFLSGVFNGFTTGTPLTILIKNNNTKSEDYERNAARPSHADYTAFVKYHGYEDFRGGGHFSGRLTAPIVAVGAIILDALNKKGIYMGTHIKKCAGVSDRDFENICEDINALDEKIFSVLNEKSETEMKEKIEASASEGDSVGGILETAVTGIPAGVGEPWFDSLESMISHGAFSIPAVKGIEFGAGFDFADMKGSASNDSFRYSDGKVVTSTNNSGGINGGITNGMPVIFRTAIKPTPSIFKEQNTIDFIKEEDTVIELKGRHDPCIVHRAAVVQTSIAALVVADLLTQRFGTDFLKN